VMFGGDCTDLAALTIGYCLGKTVFHI